MVCKSVKSELREEDLKVWEETLKVLYLWRLSKIKRITVNKKKKTTPRPPLLHPWRWTHAAYLSDNRRRTVEEGNAFVSEKKARKRRKEGERPAIRLFSKSPGTAPQAYFRV
ncbi:hypothetical protein CEXT_127911 [Caerostris extrusa]|uniref:Uncharacterized protein n=1 Tax=Caerostris extrusa TaxID=172846 RepID=A0AAV4SSJ2_CAEEX|nr:hypothetical protein CEXT_127911 [Caerostris extrusa]